jgi:hypothetical protein
VLAFWLAAAAAAAPQLPDNLVVDGRTEGLPASPLQAALESDAGLQGRLKRYMAAKPCPQAERGYVGTWEVREGALYLVKLDVDPCGAGKAVPLSLLFPNATGPVKATWYTGELKTRPGQVRYVKSGTVTGAATLERPRRQY